MYEEKRLIVSPDEVPVKQEYTREDELTWAQVEVTAEYLSSGDDDEKGLLKAITYTLYHLLSRPDRVVVPEFYFGTKVFNLIFTSASASCNTKLEWGNRDHLQLLYDFVGCILTPSLGMVDPNIVRNTNDTVDVVLKAKTYHRCKIKSFGEPIGRRTTVFETSDPDAPIIKEQYLVPPSTQVEILKRAPASFVSWTIRNIERES